MWALSAGVDRATSMGTAKASSVWTLSADAGAVWEEADAAVFLAEVTVVRGAQRGLFIGAGGGGKG